LLAFAGTRPAGERIIGSYILSMGFTFDDTDRNGVASSLANMDEVVAIHTAVKNPDVKRVWILRVAVVNAFAARFLPLGSFRFDNSRN
jgi:hypothetical protein